MNAWILFAYDGEKKVVHVTGLTAGRYMAAVLGAKTFAERYGLKQYMAVGLHQSALVAKAQLMAWLMKQGISDDEIVEIVTKIGHTIGHMIEKAHARKAATG